MFRLKRNFIPKSKYNNNEIEICSICLETFEKGENIRTTKCNHIFHVKCLDRWIYDERRNLPCPNCNRSIFNV